MWFLLAGVGCVLLLAVNSCHSPDTECAPVPVPGGELPLMTYGNP